MSRLLLIDDDDGVRNVLALGLKARGYEVEQACDGVAGERLFRKNPADLVITDLIMPEKEGLQTIGDLLRDFPKLKIIAMSGGSPKMNYDFLQIAQQMGARETLHKPFTIRELVETVERVLQQD